MKNLKKTLKEILRHDRLKHFFCGTLLFLGLSIFINPLWALIATTAIGIAKEAVYDGVMQKGNVDVLDWVYTISGALFIYLIFGG